MQISNVEIREGVGPTWIQYSDGRSISRPPDFVSVTCEGVSDRCFAGIPTTLPDSVVYISVDFGIPWKAMLIWLNE